MKTIYLAGSCEQATEDERTGWRKKCEKWIKKYADGFGAFSPVAYFDYSRADYQSESEVFRFFRRKVEAADVILVNLSNIRQSVGTICELAFAFQKNIPIIGFNMGVNYVEHPWLEEMMDRKFQEIDDALEYIRNYYK